LLKPLREFIPPKDSEKERWKYVERFVELIEKTERHFEDETVRIFLKEQRELWEEGYNEEMQEYLGSKWGKYVRAPEIFFKILNKGKKILVPLKEIATVRRGFTTGADGFFYLTDKQISKFHIEEEFVTHLDSNGQMVPNYVIKSPKESKTILVEPASLKLKVLLIHKDKSELEGTNVLKYIEKGERDRIHERPTCRSRRRWYDLGKREIAPIFWVKGIWARHVTFLNQAEAFPHQQLYEILPEKTKLSAALCAILNSSVTWLFSELVGRVTFGEGVNWIASYEAETQLLIPDIRKCDGKIVRSLERAFDDITQRSVEDVFKEIGTTSYNDVSLTKVRLDRRELDAIVMGEILGLNEKEQLEVYKAIIDLVKSRIAKAGSVRRRKKTGGIDIDFLVKSALEEIGSKLKRFPDGYVESFEYTTIEVPSGRAESGSDLQGFYVRVGGKEIRCDSANKAKFIEYAILNGYTSIKMPKDETAIDGAVKEYTKALKEAKKLVIDFVKSSVSDRKLRDEVMKKAWRMLGL
jgi:hypothetical protein